MLNLNYDKKFDILYARSLSNRDYYGDEDDDGVVTYYDIEDDSITGMAIYDFIKRFETGKIDVNQLPIRISSLASYVNRIVNSSGIEYSCDIPN